MKIINRGDAPHVLSLRGKETLLTPGSFIEADLTADEAKAIPAPFVAEGEPVKAAPEPKAAKDEAK